MKKADVLAFASDAELHLTELCHSLATRAYRHGKYTRFLIHDPKQRAIAKAVVRDRVLHHAIYRVLIPLYEKQFIFDSYASRKEKGVHAAIARLHKFAWKLSRNNTNTVWFLKCDIRKFFDSVDHERLLAFLQKKFPEEEKLMELLEKIIGSYSVGKGKGIPLGNVTSQLFANVYLDPLDQYIKRELRVKNYIRYMDDLIVIDRDRNVLETLLPKLREFLSRELRQELHPQKVTFSPWHSGIDFLGYVHFPYHRILRTTTKRRMFKKIRIASALAKEGSISSDSFNQTVASYLGVLTHCRSRTIRDELFNFFISSI